MKRILFLGASPTQIPAIRYALEQGYYVLTTDYLPNNPGHELAHESYNVSTTDFDKVLELASSLSLDGVVAYASEPAAPTSAYVSENLGLPGNSFETVSILTSKDRYRTFLETHGFACPRHRSFGSLMEARSTMAEFQLPVVVKPIDSSGSKGVTVLSDWRKLESAFSHALSFSCSKRVIFEEFVGEMGMQILGEGFVWQGKLHIACFARHRFDHRINGLVPIGGDFPYGSSELEQRLRTELQKFIDVIGLKTGPVNLEFRLGKDDRIFLMEVSPRNGGNMLPQLVTHATGFDMVKNTVNVAIGLECDQAKAYEMDGFYSYYVLHALREGRLRNLTFSKSIKERICESNIWIQPGDDVRVFTGAHLSLGVLILSFASAKEMVEVMDSIDKHVRVDIE